MIFKKNKFILSLIMFSVFLLNGVAVFASTDGAQAGVYVKQMGRGYCTLASACDMIRSKMYLEGNESWPNVTQQGMKSVAWLNGAGLLHQFTYYGTTVTYSTNKCNTPEALIKLLNEHPEGIEIYIRDLPHAVLLTRYEEETGIFYVADPVYEGEMPLMASWQRKAGSSQNAVIRTIDAYWYISDYKGTVVPGKLKGEVASSIESKVEEEPQVKLDVVNDSELFLKDQEVMDDDLIFVKSTVKLPYVNNYNETNFIDVKKGAWYVPSIKAAYEMAMMIGISNNEFHVNGNITLAQTICITARIHNIYYKNNYDFSAIGGEPWFMPYIRYTKEKGILDKKYDILYNQKLNYDEEALRIEFAEIISKSLPENQLTMIKKVDSIPDIPINNNDENFKIIYQLYNAGILIGDGEGFKPYKKITRAEIAAVVSRVADASLRIE